MIPHRSEIDPNYQLTDREAVLHALRKAGDAGVHSHDLRRGGYSGNVSERVRELRRHGYELRVEREHRGRRQGVRITLTGDGPAPIDAQRRETPDAVGGLFEVPHQAQNALDDEWAA